MSLSLVRPLSAALWCCLALTGAAHAQTLPSLREALDASWALSPHARSLQSRQAELEARSHAAAALLPGPPNVGVSHRAGRGNAAGSRESEAEVAVPLWSTRLRAATAAQVEAERAAFAGQQSVLRLRLAAEVRELAAQAALARIERQVAERKLQHATALAADVERRVRAGEVARIDLLNARSVQSQAATAGAQAESALARTLAQWRGLTGLPQVSALDEAQRLPAEDPVVDAAEAQVRAARAKFAATEADVRDPMEVGLGFARERAGGGVPAETYWKISVRVPLGSHGRNAPKLAAARAELDTAEAELEAARRTAAAERESSSLDLVATGHAEQLAMDRERLALEAQALIAKSHALGESDLPTRLRADAERFDAELARARAGVETRRAISKFNQSHGVLP